MVSDLRRDFNNRDELVAYLRTEFPEAVNRDDHVSDTLGGRHTAENVLAVVDPAQYAETRTYLDGDATLLSAYIRHGVLSLAEVRDAVLAMVTHKHDAAKLVNELAWRDYFQRVYALIGDGIWEDQEAYKTGLSAHDYADKLPDAVTSGETGMACIDSFRNQLHETVYLHNHARMWLAAYVVHWRRVKWQVGAKWFLTHLLDGDPASNNLSWQWVASTFSHKPYFFNRESLEKFTNGRYCKDCPLYKQCDFEGTYESIEARLFPDTDRRNQVSKHG